MACTWYIQYSVQSLEALDAAYPLPVKTGCTADLVAVLKKATPFVQGMPLHDEDFELRSAQTQHNPGT